MTASTGWLLAGAGANGDYGPGGIAWDNAGNITADDDTAATPQFNLNGSVPTDYLQATDFGASIPAGAILTGVEVRIQRLRTAAGSGVMADRVVSLIVGGTIVGDNNADTTTDWPGTFTDKDYGGAFDLWGLGLTLEQVQASDFGVALQAEFVTPSGNRSVSVDAIWINIHYTFAVGRGYIIG